MRIALGIEYNGSNFHGWQYQPGLATIQGALQRAIEAIAAQPITLFCAGRTDAGVHAHVQIVHFDTNVCRPINAWVRGVNSHLPDDIAVLWSREVSDRFHARFDAHTRHYRYLLLHRSQRLAIFHRQAGWTHRSLNLTAMQKAAHCLLGEQDFSSFRAAECQAKNPVKTMRHISIAQQDNWFIFDFSASAFLHHMVRNLVGALVTVGRGDRPIEWLAQVLTQRDRKAAGATMPACGLYFLGADYEPSWGIPLTNIKPVAPDRLY